MSIRFDYIPILACIRQLNVSVHMQILRTIARDKDEFDQVLEEVRDWVETRADDTFSNLTEMLASVAYQDFLEVLNNVDGDASLVAQTLLEKREYELRLQRLKQESHVAYVDELRVVPKEELYRAIVDGTIVNATDERGVALPIQSDEGYSGAFLEQPTATAWVEASDLLEVLNYFSSEKSELIASAQGLRLRQVVIGGDTLNLNWLNIPFPVGFHGCDFYTWVSADYLRVPWLSFDTCDFTPHGNTLHSTRGALNAHNLEVKHELRFWDCRGFTQLFIPNAKVGTFSLRNPNEEDNASEQANDVAQSFRTVVSGASFGELHIPRVDQGESLLPIELDTSIRIERLSGDLDAIVLWMQHNDADGPVWDSIADALLRSGRADDATYIRIAYKRHRNGHRDLLKAWRKQQSKIAREQVRLEKRHNKLKKSAERNGDPAPSEQSQPKHLRRNVILRPIVWLFGDFTVRYFHKPFRAIGLLIATFMVTWVVAFIFHDQLIKSPLANDPIPESWLQEVASSIAWAFMYALDSSFSPLSLGQLETMWPSSVWLVLVLAALKAISIILLGLFIAAVTNLVSKRSE